MKFKPTRRRLVLRTPRPRKTFPANGQKLIRKIAEFDSLIRSHGITLNLEASDYARDLFCRFSLAAQKRIVNSFEIYVETVQDLTRRAHHPHDSLKLTWAFLQKSGWHPHSRLFHSVGRQEVIEIFNKDFVQVFRSLNFFEFFDLPVFDLLVLDRMTILKSHPKTEEQLFLSLDAALKTNSGLRLLTEQPQPWTQRFGSDERVHLIQGKSLSSLLERGRRPARVQAVITSSLVEPAESGELSLAVS
jgi:hypothetical protein